MMLQVLLVAHIAVLGYWLGAELVINSTYRFVSRAAAMPFAQRDRLMDHVMDVDQHVRYALVLQAGLGTMLAAARGDFPGGTALVWAAAAAMAAWLALVEATHRRRGTAAGRRLAALDRVIRASAIALLVVAAMAALAGRIAVAPWLAWKLAAFAGVIACGLAIRFALVRFYRTWEVIRREGPSDARESEVRAVYVQATSILFVLWAFIAVITGLSIAKP
jgi:hypothetical protein